MTSRDHGRADDDAPTVPNLPVVPGPEVVQGEQGPVYEGEVLSEVENDYIERHFAYHCNEARAGTAGGSQAGGSQAGRDSAVVVQRRAQVARRARPAVAVREAGAVVRRRAGRAGVFVVTAVRVAVTHEHTKTAARFAIRNAVVYVPTGLWVVLARVWEARTNVRYERMMRCAEAVGDIDRLIEWEARAERARAMRHRRRMDWIAAPFAIARGLAVGAATVVVMLLAVGITVAVANSDASWILAPLKAAIDFIAFLVWVVSVVWLPMVLALPWLALAGLWQLGRTRGAVPGWAAPTSDRAQETVIVTPGGVATALAHLGIGSLNKAIKEGWRVEFSTPPVRVNRKGYHTVFSLPMGVTPEMIADKRDVLARNLVRHPLEVWPAAAQQAGYVDLWVADQGAIEKPAPPYPLLHDGTTDVFDGIPIGVSQRGEVISVVLPGANLVFGGIMGSGKSNAARVVMIGAALDPIAELWVFVFANNGDFDAYRPRLSRYWRGVDDDIAAAALEALRHLYAEVGRREARLAELGAKKVTRQLAERHSDLRPKVTLFSECHELFGHEAYGKEAADLAVQTLRRARKTAITLAFDTQSSRADAIPPKIVELVKINACFAVKSWRSNDGFLGDGSFAAGIRATELRPGKDTGTSLLTGATAERFEIVKWFYIAADDDTGHDDATDTIARAMNNLHPAIAEETKEDEQKADRDLLEDLDAVLGVDKIGVADVPALLRDLAPSYRPYVGLTGSRLREILDREHGIKVPSTHNTWPLDPATVRARIAQRTAAHSHQQGGDGG